MTSESNREKGKAFHSIRLQRSLSHEKDPMTTIRDHLLAFLEEDEWPISQSDESSLIRSGFEGENGQFELYFACREEQYQLVCYSICSLDTPLDRLDKLAELTTRINYKIVIGNFELDFEDGEVRYKTSIDVEDTEINGMLIRNLVYANVLTMDQHLPSIYAAMLTELSAEQSLALVDNPEAIADDIWEMLRSLISSAVSAL